jgi:hypothetical protein
MPRIFISIIVCCMMQAALGQELYVFSEPASNMPAQSVATKLTYRTPVSKYNNYYKQRYTPEIMFGLSREWMVHLSTTFSDFYSPAVRWESIKGYAKWRFYSNDDVHQHFRLAAYAEGSYSRSPFYYGEINLDGDNSGVQGGLIATQLINKLAVSASAGVIKIFADRGLHADHFGHSLSGLNYNLSAGYLLLPRSYTNYRQLNVNLYVEALGMKGFENSDYMLDIAPALQFIFNSNFKINLGARFQASGNMLRVGEKNYFISLERTFLGALQRKKKSI